MTVIETMMGCHRKYDGLGCFQGLTVIETMTSLPTIPSELKLTFIGKALTLVVNPNSGQLERQDQEHGSSCLLASLENALEGVGLISPALSTQYQTPLSLCTATIQIIGVSHNQTKDKCYAN